MLGILGASMGAQVKRNRQLQSTLVEAMKQALAHLQNLKMFRQDDPDVVRIESALRKKIVEQTETRSAEDTGKAA